MSELPRATPGARLGSTISGAFGLVYVEANAGQIPAPAGPALRIAAAAAFALLLLGLLATRHARTPRGGGDGSGAAPGFDRRYWLVVAAEAVAIVAGSAIVRGPLGLPDATVAWVSIVVGAHFFGLAAIWDMAPFRALGAAIGACGAVGLIAAAAGAGAAAVALAGGVLPGALLLAAGGWGVARLAAA